VPGKTVSFFGIPPTDSVRRAAISRTYAGMVFFLRRTHDIIIHYTLYYMVVRLSDIASRYVIYMPRRIYKSLMGIILNSVYEYVLRGLRTQTHTRSIPRLGSVRVHARV